MAEDATVPEVEVAEAPVVAPAAPEPIDHMEALRRVLRLALVADGLRRGLHECIKALAKAQRGSDGQLAVAPGGARLCCLALDCDEPAYTKLVR